jgi:hypothetical protein
MMQSLRDITIKGEAIAWLEFCKLVIIQLPREHIDAPNNGVLSSKLDFVPREEGAPMHSMVTGLRKKSARRNAINTSLA